MKRIPGCTIALIILFLSATELSAQTKPKAKAAAKPAEKGALFFDQTYVNVGKVDDTQEYVPATFTFRNVGTAPVTISAIKVGCSCLAAEWTKEPLKFNEQGKITVFYYPKGQSGNQQKEITVTTNGHPATYTLKLSAYVNDKNAMLVKQYPSAQGNLRFNTYDIDFKELTTSSVDSAEISIFNTTDRIVRINGISSPPHIRVAAGKMSIAPQQGVSVKLTYLALAANDYGFRKDEVVLHTFGDTLFPDKKILVKATIKEDFSALTEKQKSNPPVFEAVTPVVNLDTLDINSVDTAVFVITNKGKSPMYIRKAYGSCGCTQVDYDSSTPIKRNKTATVRVVYNTTTEIGPVSKKVFVITNTPQQTLHELELKAHIVYRKKK